VKTILFIVLLLLSTSAQAQGGNEDPCLAFNPQRTTEFPPPVSLEEGIKKMGREQANLAINEAIEILAACRYLRNDPYNWSHRRLAAMALVDAVLPITVDRINFSANCHSALPTRGCQVLIDYHIENVSDDFMFSSVGVSCQGMLKFSYRRPGVPDRPRYAQLALVHYDPVIEGRALGPHETRQFSMWFKIGTALNVYGENNPTRVVDARGESDFCHVIRVKRLEEGPR
jgi:hypothetical protein